MFAKRYITAFQREFKEVNKGCIEKKCAKNIIIYYFLKSNEKQINLKKCLIPIIDTLMTLVLF
jgi:hypothetical protein